MDLAAEKILTEHLPYQLEHALGRAPVFVFQQSKHHKGQGQKISLLNTVIELFWTHARNLNEFFDEKTGGSSGVASARDFTNEDGDFKATLEEDL